MATFEEEKKNALTTSELKGKSPAEIAEIADDVLYNKAMAGFVREYFETQKSFGEFLGVGESTVAGWMKNASFPDYAKRAALAAYYAQKHFRALDRATVEAERPKIVKDMDTFMIVKFESDETGVAIGKVLARDIGSEKAALVFAGGLRAWDLLERAEQLIEEQPRFDDPEFSESLKEMVKDIRHERARTFAHEKYRELLQRQAQHKADRVREDGEFISELLPANPEIEVEFVKDLKSSEEGRFKHALRATSDETVGGSNSNDET